MGQTFLCERAHSLMDLALQYIPKAHMEWHRNLLWNPAKSLDSFFMSFDVLTSHAKEAAPVQVQGVEDLASQKWDVSQ